MSEKKRRILVISDSHGRNDDVAGVIEQVGHIDMLIHCGDVERGDDYIRSLVDCPVVSHLTQVKHVVTLTAL